MTALTKAITSHDLNEIEKIISEAPSLVFDKENGWLPIEWAEKTGNAVTFTRTARFVCFDIPENNARKWLEEYISLITATEYEALPKGKEADMIWATLFEGAPIKIDRWERPLINSVEQVEDIKYLIKKSGISTLEMFREFVKNA